MCLPPPVLKGLLDHGGPHDHDKRQKDADGPVGGEGAEGDDADDEEEHVRHPPELLEEGLRDEVGHRISGGGDGIPWVVKMRRLRAPRIVAVHYPQVACSSAPVAGRRRAGAGEQAHLAEMEHPPPLPRH